MGERSSSCGNHVFFVLDLPGSLRDGQQDELDSTLRFCYKSAKAGKGVGGRRAWQRVDLEQLTVLQGAGGRKDKCDQPCSKGSCGEKGGFFLLLCPT